MTHAKQKVSKVLIVGGGSAGWMTAAMLSKVLGSEISITLVESDEISTVGVGEATIPPIQFFNNVLGLDEADFLKQTQGTYKLGIQFENWGRQGDSYMHAFGPLGKNMGLVGFQHYWLRARQQGLASDLWDYSYNFQGGKHNKFDKAKTIPGTQLPGLAYAYHFDAGLYAMMLRRYSESNKVRRIEGKVEDVLLNPESGHIQSVRLENGQALAADLFIDCSGFRGLLIEQTLKSGYEDWTHWLPCDRAIAVQCEGVEPLVPYTRAIAHTAGWQWRIPLQNRIGNGSVYCSEYLSDDQAMDMLLSNLDASPITEPKLIKFKTGRRKRQWNKNCVAIGLSCGFMEPIESTSLHLIQQSITRLIKLFPGQGIQQADADEYNRQSQVEFERIRDFIILHYHLNQRGDSDFWKACQNMSIPDSLRHKMALFASSGRVFREQEELFTEAAWLQVMVGQNLIPQDYHPMANQMTERQLSEFMANLKHIINRGVGTLPGHQAFIEQYCKSNNMG